MYDGKFTEIVWACAGQTIYSCTKKLWLLDIELVFM